MWKGLGWTRSVRSPQQCKECYRFTDTVSQLTFVRSSLSNAHRSMVFFRNQTFALPVWVTIFSWLSSEEETPWKWLKFYSKSWVLCPHCWVELSMCTQLNSWQTVLYSNSTHCHQVTSLTQDRGDLYVRDPEESKKGPLSDPVNIPEVWESEVDGCGCWSLHHIRKKKIKKKSRNFLFTVVTPVTTGLDLDLTLQVKGLPETLQA